MGLTYRSTQRKALQDLFQINREDDQFVIALAGNPNTGKSTVFNALTGLHQHTGNWPGKTVTNARGEFKTKTHRYVLVDLPGTYSLFATSEEEIVARDFICFGQPDLVVVVTDATALERNLHLALQIMELSHHVILCINLIDEAKKKGFVVNKQAIEDDLGIPVVLTSARSGLGLEDLKSLVDQVVENQYPFHQHPLLYSQATEHQVNALAPLLNEKFPTINSRWLALRLLDGNESIFQSMNQYFSAEQAQSLQTIAKTHLPSLNKDRLREELTEVSYAKAEQVKKDYVYLLDKKQLARERDLKIDNIITSKRFGIPLMLLLLFGIFWMTIAGANIPSALLADAFSYLETYLDQFLAWIHTPTWLHQLLLLGIYQTLANVIAVMLPPMAIFFPIFTLLEDLGYLPRVAFNLDHLFKKACAHGKQCLTMCMSFGCNAAGVIGCRIIDSPREKLIAILTNNFIICNGRFPTIITIASVLLLTFNLNSFQNSLMGALAVSLIVILGVIITLLVSYILSKTLLKGVPSTFTLELPPYRAPQIGRILYTSIIDLTLFVL
nr:ferrous iron transport protein B [Turicibacter sp.]